MRKTEVYDILRYKTRNPITSNVLANNVACIRSETEAHTRRAPRYVNRAIATLKTC